MRTNLAGCPALFRHALALAASLLLAGAPANAQAPATTITVTTTADVLDFAGMRQVSDLPGPDGVVSLREAIAAANNTGGPQTIVFNIPLSDAGYSGSIGVFVIQVQQDAALTITDDGTTIDATTQAAFTGDTNPTGGEVNLSTTPIQAHLTGIRVVSDGNVIRGLVGFNIFQFGVDVVGDDNVVAACNFAQSGSAAVRVTGSNNRVGGTSPGDRNTIRTSGGNGVWIAGPAATGNAVEGNLIVNHHTNGVVVEGSGNRVGGTEPGAGNVIHSNGHTSGGGAPVGANVVVEGTNNLLLGNKVGVDETGTVDMGNIHHGVVVTGSGHAIGGTEPGAGNVISGHNYAGTSINHWSYGLIVGGSSVTVQGNRIGTDASGTIPLPNVVGVYVSGSDVMIGGGLAGAGNTIALNIRDGVALPTGSQAAVRISRNSIYGNGELGINLDYDPFSLLAYPNTVTQNDAGDGDAGPNRLQNFPVVHSAVSNGGTTFVTGVVDTQNPTTVTVEIFSSGGADPSGFGEGQTFEIAVVPTSTGSFFATIPRSLAGKYVTATATAADGSTSEFSDAEQTTGGVPGRIDVVFPHAGDTWQSGTTRDIRWNTMGSVARVSVRVSYDGGAHFDTLATDVPNTGSFAWSIAAATTPNATVHVASVTDPSLRDASDLFSLAPGPAPNSSTPGIYVPATGAVFLRNTATPGPADFTFPYGPAAAGWLPITGDWDGDGRETIGLYDPSSGFFFLRNEQAPGPGNFVFAFGPTSSPLRPIAGDWDGDGVDTVGLYDPATGFFFLRNAHAPGAADVTFAFGAGGQGAVPVAGDWDGDDDDSVGIFVPSTATFFLRDTLEGGAANHTFAYGAAGATPIAGDWDGDGIETVGVYAPATGAWFLRNSNTSGAADLTFFYGPPGATPLSGDWDGQ